MEPTGNARTDQIDSARVFSFISSVFPAMTWLFLLWAVFTMTVDYYDTFGYFASAKYLWGDDPYFYGKNPGIIGFFALLHGVQKLFGFEPTLLLYQLPMFAFHTAFVVLTAKWIREFVPGLPLPLIMGVAMWNRVVLHYFPFALPDLFCAFSVAWWFWVDLKVPSNTLKGRWLRALILAVCAIVRLHTPIIPVVALSVTAYRTRSARQILELGAMSLSMFLAANVVFALFSYPHLGFWDAIGALYIEYSNYIGAVATSTQPAYITIDCFFKTLTPWGFALFVGGLFVYFKSERDPRLTGPLLGSLAYFILLLSMGQREGRYIAQILSVCALLQCFAIAALLKRKNIFALGATVLLFATAALPEMVRLADPFYREDIPRNTAKKITEWDRSGKIAFIIPMASLYPRDHYFHWNDVAYYFYHWSSIAFNFFSPHKAVTLRGLSPSFKKYGFPILDNIDKIAEPGTTLVAPMGGFGTTQAPANVPPIFAVRWWPKGTPDANCVPQVSDLCVEVLVAFEGIRRESN